MLKHHSTRCVYMPKTESKMNIFNTFGDSDRFPILGYSYSSVDDNGCYSSLHHIFSTRTAFLSHHVCQGQTTMPLILLRCGAIKRHRLVKHRTRHKPCPSKTGN